MQRITACGVLTVGVLLASGLLKGVRVSGQDSAATSKKNGVTCETTMVPMRDGTLLATDVYRPSTPGPHPVLMQRSPFGGRLGHACFEGASNVMAFWAENGFVALLQDVRGTGRSQGTFRPIVQEQADGYDAVEWAATQQWSTGKVGMLGTQYFGVTQWQAALAAPPHLTAISPGQTATDYHDHWTYMNGVFDLWFAQSWILNYLAPDAHQRQLRQKGMPAADARKAGDEYLARGKQSVFATWVHHVPLSSFPEFRTLAPYYYEWLDHPNYDDYWAKVDVEAQWSKIKVPALVHGGWGDLFAVGSIRGYQGMRAHAGSDLARSDTRLVMQSGGHGGLGVLSYANADSVSLRQVQLRFFDRHLKGLDNGLEKDPRVQLFLQIPPDEGTKAGGQWVSGETFPLPGTEHVRFYLSSKGRAHTANGDGVLSTSRPEPGPANTFVYDPAKPAPSHGGGLCCTPLGPYFGSGAQDQSDLERRDDVLVFTSAPLTSDLAVIGQAKVKFWATSSARDTDFTAKLVDVYPSGFAQNVLDRVVRARFRRGSKLAPSLIEPGKPYEYEIDLGYTASVVKAGHRLRLDVSSSNFPHLARNQNTGNHSATDAELRVARQTLLLDRGHEGYVELSVAPARR